MQELSWRTRLGAIGATIALFALIWLYTREFPVLTNTLQAERIVLGAVFFGALAAGALLYALRNRLTPWRNHLPEVLLIAIFLPLFSPLIASLINRAGGKVSHQTFEFVSETPYVAAAYGWLRFQPIEVTGYRLVVREGNRLHRFQYRKQPYFPLTRPGEQVLLPVRRGLLGVEVMVLK